jgi:aspartyl-tRNA(Asn)/glutamyl-tRNA(Gln) amidotransferase subunit A
MSNDLAFMSATDLLNSYRSGALSPVEVVEACLSQIELHGAKLNAFTLVDTDNARQKALESQGRWQSKKPMGLLDGVPTTIKDLIITKGWPTLRGSRTINPQQEWNEDAPCVERLKENGAILIGKTATPQFGHKGVTDSLLQGITRNPWNLRKTPGGSSGGASAAVASGMGQLAIGTDAGGSIRIPAGFTGIYGLKPSFGRVPAYPASPFGTLAHAGPMSRTVADAALMLEVISQPDARDWRSLPPTNSNYRKSLDPNMKGKKIAFCPDLGLDIKINSEVSTSLTAAADCFQSLGATVDTPQLKWPADPRDVIVVYFASGAALMASMLPSAHRDLLEPTLIAMVEHGEKLSMLSVKAAESDRVANGIYMNKFFTTYDFLICPTLPIVAFDAGEPNPPEYKDDTLGWTPLTGPFNLTGQPAASIPCGFDKGGLPIGLQIIGSMYDDAGVLSCSLAFENACAFTNNRPPSIK